MSKGAAIKMCEIITDNPYYRHLERSNKRLSFFMSAVEGPVLFRDWIYRKIGI